jgi:hypothetical protein
MCRMAYQCRKDPEMELLKALSQEPSYKSSEDAIHHQYKALRHGIGRLGSHFRAARILVTSISKLSSLLDSYDICEIPTPLRAQPPPVDSKTNLDSIVVRMVSEKSKALEYQQVLSDLDQKFGIMEKFLKIYTGPKFRPRVHAEVQVLDYFWDHRLQFDDGDAYIAISKPACYCCSLYFRYHPRDPELPASHQNIHRNWRPPDFQPDNNRQRDILNQMNVRIREQVLQQLGPNGKAYPWHPDSITGITESELPAIGQSSLEHNLESLRIGENSGNFQPLENN